MLQTSYLTTTLGAIKRMKGINQMKEVVDG